MRVWLFTLGIFAAGSAAAQTGTYRPGSPYAANPATAPDQCVAQCAGDAACRGWNFVQINAEAAVCEFNSRSATPVPSPNSISGPQAGALPASDRLVRLPGQMTTRIGTPAKPRRVVREAPPQAILARPAATPRRIVPRPAQQNPQPIPSRPIPSQPMAPRFQHSLDGSNHIAPVRRPVVPQPPMAAQQSPFAPQAARPSPQAQPASVAQAPRFVPAQPAPATPATPAPLLPMHNAAAAQESLFGSLYDDVSVPAPADPVALADPDAPVATAVAVPVVPVTQENLKGLAGGR